MKFDFDDLIVPAIAFICVAMIVIVAVAAIDDARKWKAFKADHHCKIVAQIKGEVFNTFGTNSSGHMTVGIGTTSDKSGWLCDDGITYYR